VIDLIKHNWSTLKETKVKSTKTVKEAYAFLVLTLAFSYFVFWGPLALFKIPAISFVSDVKGPAWAIALFFIGGFVPSLLAIFLTWKKEGLSGLRLLGRRMIQFKLCSSVRCQKKSVGVDMHWKNFRHGGVQ
jgi:hypothetical protein